MFPGGNKKIFKLTREYKLYVNMMHFKMANIYWNKKVFKHIIQNVWRIIFFYKLLATLKLPIIYYFSLKSVMNELEDIGSKSPVKDFYSFQVNKNNHTAETTNLYRSFQNTYIEVVLVLICFFSPFFIYLHCLLRSQFL